jgi:Zn-dependent peptidase ImmA (M78 family)
MITVPIREDGVLWRWLRTHYLGKSVRDVACNIVSEWLRQAKIVSHPIDVTAFFSRRHILRLEWRRTSRRQTGHDANLRVVNGGFIIEIWGAGDARRQFTLAHELGHTVFYDLQTKRPTRMVDGIAPSEEEAFCDVFASELVLPRRQLYSVMNQIAARGDVKSPLEYIRILANDFEVSTEVVGRRMVEDLAILHGALVGLRWLPKSEDTVESWDSWAWRVAWRAISSDLAKVHYFPPVQKRPKARMPLVEDSFSGRRAVHSRIGISMVRFGSLGKALGSLGSAMNQTDVWIIPIVPEAVQLPLPMEDGSRLDDEEVIRRASEILVFFPLNGTEGQRQMPGRLDAVYVGDSLSE